MGRVPGLIHNLVVPTELPLSVLEKSPCCNASQGCESLMSDSSPVATNRKTPGWLLGSVCCWIVLYTVLPWLDGH